MESMPLFPRRCQAKEAKKETCVICFDDIIDLALMFVVGESGHRFCLTCVKQHIEVQLLDQKIPNFPQHLCKSHELSFVRCEKLLTAKLSFMWRQRIRKDSIPFEQRFYCPRI
ncbi:E3 ubiquitin-protein ligase RSL1 [Cardamine amara subsp. amara]|uniref:E3 ubiquitin-protein ligase RSL1 n=1 Tax=Cardamine amara subsp. amara TaxID=228776 RepID=A0ABD1APB6_CARAN